MKVKEEEKLEEKKLNKLSFQELCSQIEFRLEDIATSEQVKYLFGWFMGYREAFNYNSFKNKLDIEAKERVLEKITNKYKELKRKGL